MVNSITGSSSLDPFTGIQRPATTPSESASSFTDQLTTALNGYPAQSGSSSDLGNETQSQDSGGSQFPVTGQTPQAQAVSAQAGGSPSAPLDAADQASLNQMAENDAYWAAQPPAVQQLRNVSDFGQRSAMAQNLADQGYTIDRAIMVWGWDPMKTMAARQIDGYTWVPSYNQASVTPPQSALPDETPYDSTNPPAGSVAVNTDFANGLGITNPWA